MSDCSIKTQVFLIQLPPSHVYKKQASGNSRAFLLLFGELLISIWTLPLVCLIFFLYCQELNPGSHLILLLVLLIIFTFWV